MAHKEDTLLIGAHVEHALKHRVVSIAEYNRISVSKLIISLLNGLVNDLDEKGSSRYDASIASDK